MKKLIFYSIIALALGCKDAIVEDTIKIKDDFKLLELNSELRTTVNTRAYVYLDNPYSLDNMQDVYNLFSSEDIDLEPTHLYVRFQPHDSAQLASLINDYEIELFEYPLNIELEEGEEFVDATIVEGEFNWLYSVVLPDFQFPTDITWQILEECYIPAEDEVIVTSESRGENVEECVINVEAMAYELLSYDYNESTKSSRGRTRPKGYLNVCNNSKELEVSYIPLKGVKVRCNRFVKYSTTFTDEAGYYVMDSKFAGKPRFTVVFDNCKDFEIWGKLGPLARANYNMGKHSADDILLRNIDTISDAWQWAVVNNAAYDYYKFCEETGITKPPVDLKIWVMNNVAKSSAGMYRRIDDVITIGGSALNDFLNYMLGYNANALFQEINFMLSDLTIGTKNKSYDEIYNNVNHELAHASHFAVVGSEYWAKYISYIVSYGAYGNGDGYNSELCGIGEMWGFAVGEIRMREELYRDKIFGEYNGSHKNNWFKPHVIWDLYRDSILSLKEIHECMLPYVMSYKQLISEFYMRHPNELDRITSVFVTHGLIDDNQYNNGDINYDSFLINQSLYHNYVHTGNNVYAFYINVYPEVNLVIEATNSITIDYPLIVYPGASFVMRTVNN